MTSIKASNFHASFRSLTNETSFELSERSHDMEYQSATRGIGIDLLP
nr:hypothetical protein [Pelagibacterium lentulum]